MEMVKFAIKPVEQKVLRHSVLHGVLFGCFFSQTAKEMWQIIL